MVETALNWLDSLLFGVRRIIYSGDELPERPTLEVGAGLVVTDDPANNRTKLESVAVDTAQLGTEIVIKSPNGTVRIRIDNDGIAFNGEPPVGKIVVTGDWQTQGDLIGKQILGVLVALGVAEDQTTG